jgi:hypothetical protein
MSTEILKTANSKTDISRNPKTIPIKVFRFFIFEAFGCNALPIGIWGFSQVVLAKLRATLLQSPAFEYWYFIELLD